MVVCCLNNTFLLIKRLHAMDIRRLSTIILFLGLVLKDVLQVDCFVDPVTLVVGGTAVGIVSYILKNPETKDSAVKFTYRTLNKACQMIGVCEGCEDYWIPSNLQSLEYELKSEVFGQPLANEIVLSALKRHLKSANPERSLVLSFHGSPGIGKNFLSNKVLKNMFREGVRTKYVKFFRSSIDFPSFSEVDMYKKALIQTIKDMVYECHRSVFVFDEVEKMPHGILDVISGFVNTGKEGDFDYRRVIFILLGNVGSEALTSYALNAWSSGIPREEVSVSELNKVLANAAYNNAGGLKYSRLIKNHDISYYVPFLPLERQHIVQCLEREVRNRKQIMSVELVELVLEELNFYPDPEQIFAVSGCKGVGEAADRLIERETRRRRKLQ